MLSLCHALCVVNQIWERSFNFAKYATVDQQTCMDGNLSHLNIPAASDPIQYCFQIISANENVNFSILICENHYNTSYYNLGKFWLVIQNFTGTEDFIFFCYAAKCGHWREPWVQKTRMLI